MLHVNHSLRRVRLNRRGYDASGCYWGAGAPLYVCDYRAINERDIQTDYLRANTREEAVAKARNAIAAYYLADAATVVLWRGNV